MNNTYSREQLNSMNKDALITLVLSLSSQLGEMNKKMDSMLETLKIMQSGRFGKSSEAKLIDGEQVSIFNEAEALQTKEPEPEIEEVVKSYRRKKKRKLSEDLADFPVTEVMHELSDEELAERFPDGYTRLPDEVYNKLEYHKAWHEVLEHHIAVYKAKKTGEIVKAPHPVEMLEHSIATPSLVSAVYNGKYTNALPLNRIEAELERNGVHISRQTMANWCITLSERYLSLIYDRLKKEIISSPVVHADETPVTVVKDGREGIHKNYMWVYRTGEYGKLNPAIVYDFQTTRKQEHPEEFLKGFKGSLVCDGYAAYHSLEKKNSDIKVGGCWVHARRPFAEVLKTIDKDKQKGTIAYDAVVQIANIAHVNKTLYKLPPSERKKKRKLLVKPLVDNFFNWIKEEQKQILGGSKTSDGIKYCINQEKYLRLFLEEPNVPMDNNAAERAIRSFCVGKNNWKIIDTIHGAQASAIAYSIVETAKANDLKIYEYFKYLFEEIPKHMEDTDLAFIEDLLPWSKALPAEIKKPKKEE